MNVKFELDKYFANKRSAEYSKNADSIRQSRIEGNKLMRKIARKDRRASFKDYGEYPPSLENLHWEYFCSPFDHSP